MYLVKAHQAKRVGFVSTRFKGIDGVILETDKRATVLQRIGFECYYFCGQSDRPRQ